MQSTRARGKGGVVAYHPGTGNVGAVYRGPTDPKTHKETWISETARSSKPGEPHPDASTQTKTFPSQQAAQTHMATHVYGHGPVQKIAIRRPLPALARRGAMPLEKMMRLVTVRVSRSPQEPHPEPNPEPGPAAPRKLIKIQISSATNVNPTESEPRKVRVSPIGEKNGHPEKP